MNKLQQSACLIIFSLFATTKPIVPENDGAKFTIENITGNVDFVGSIPSDVHTIINTIKNPERFIRVGAPLPKGILMMGHPGVGKTTIARLIAKETECPIIITSAAQFVNTYVGTGPAAIRSLFKTARDKLTQQDDPYAYDTEPYHHRPRQSKKDQKKKDVKPVIVFIDEIDSIGVNRGQMTGGAGMEERNTLNQLFTEMEGLHECNNIIVIAASNEDEGYFDAALRSRFTYIAHVPLPNYVDRTAILKHFSTKSLFAPGISLEYLSGDEYTQGYAGRDLKKLVEHIARTAANDMSLANDKVVITQTHITIGFKEYNDRKKREAESEAKRREAEAEAKRRSPW